MLEIACFVDAGIRAPKNDDRVAINNKLVSQGSYAESTETNCMLIVCDGVGGERGGNEAADLVTRIFSTYYNRQHNDTSIKSIIAEANTAVLSARKKNHLHSRMSTTLAGLCINGDDFVAFNIGDSRIYRFRAPYIMQISKDHSIRQEKIDAGEEPKSEQDNIITRCIGEIAIPYIINGSGKVFVNDVFLLCSDGVWGVLDDDDFEKTLLIKGDLDTKCQLLVELALKKGSEDNLSIIMVRRT